MGWAKTAIVCGRLRECDYWATVLLWLAEPLDSSQRMGEAAENRKEIKVTLR